MSLNSTMLPELESVFIIHKASERVRTTGRGGSDVKVRDERVSCSPGFRVMYTELLHLELFKTNPPQTLIMLPHNLFALA